MFFGILFGSLLVAVTTVVVANHFFKSSIELILKRLVGDDFAAAWQRYIRFVMWVVGVSNGVNIYFIERYIAPPDPNQAPLTLNIERLGLEMYRAWIETLESVAWVLLIFFVVSLLAYVMMRRQESRHKQAHHDS